MFIRADQLLNITITKTGLDLVQRLSVLFNDVYNKRLPFTDDNRPMLSLFNGTGRELFIDDLDGLEVNFLFFLNFVFKFSFIYQKKSLLKMLH
jgi:hypothetical protein